MISDRKIWIYREIYSEIEKKCNYNFLSIPQGLSFSETLNIAKREHDKKKLNLDLKLIIIEKALDHFYPNELSIHDYETMKQLDFIQRIARIQRKHQKRLVLDVNDEKFDNAEDAIPLSTSELRCPKRSMDKDNPELFYYIEKPSDLDSIKNGQVFINWIILENNNSIKKGTSYEKTQFN